MRIILIANFLSDGQESMNRFAQMLDAGFRNSGYESDIWLPTPVFSRRAKSTLFGMGKWLAYIDKWVIFSFTLRWRIIKQGLNKHNVYFHVCDHSNAPYLNHLPTDRSGITCHDVLAIRGAMGYADAYCSATRTGKIYQKWILSSLVRAKKIAAVSERTLSQLRELSLGYASEQKEWKVIHNAFNEDFYPMKSSEYALLLAKVGIKWNEPFLLHVGSGLPRKNRKLLLDMVAVLGDKWHGRICYAGKAIDETMITYADSLGLKDRIISIVRPDHSVLVALYSACQAFVFPSFSEGFGWPVIEAQACGAPVIASIVEPMPEVSGGAALYADPNSPQEFATAFRLLEKEETRTTFVKRGFENCKRYEPSHMIDAYLDLYGVNRIDYAEL